ncbi:MAG TPA: hypothetical protein VLG71_01180 [Candidatus Limnocylindria bacterium]|nr:hypothetical protein [Candidatus Limnocylindria bacterium]
MNCSRTVIISLVVFAALVAGIIFMRRRAEPVVEQPAPAMAAMPQEAAPAAPAQEAPAGEAAAAPAAPAETATA